MKKIKVGYLPLYIKLYDDSNPHYRDPMVDYMHMLIKMLESQGLEVVLADEVCRIKPEFDRAAKKFNDAGVSAVITQHLAYSPSLESIEALLSLDAPIIVFDTTPDYQLLKVANYKGCISANHGIHGVQDMCNLLKRNGKPYYLCVGHALHSEVVSEVVGMCRAAAVKKAFQTEKVGSVGGSFTGMGDFLVSDERYKNDIGVEVQYMTTEVVKEYLPKVTEEEIDAELAYDAAHYDSDITFQAEYREATRSGLAVRKWMQDNGLHAATVNFLTLDICGLPKMPFIECCKIMERGQGYAGEGDVLTAGLVGALLQVYLYRDVLPGLGAGRHPPEPHGRKQPEAGAVEAAHQRLPVQLQLLRRHHRHVQLPAQGQGRVCQPRTHAGSFQPHRLRRGDAGRGS